jgi:hypothetical protein
MVENQQMQIDRIIEIIKKRGVVNSLEIDMSISMSGFENQVLEVGKDIGRIEKFIVKELLERVSKVESIAGDTDRAMGLALPNRDEIESFASKVAPLLAGLPDPESSDYKVALAGVFGGALQLTARISSAEQPTADRYPVYCQSKRKGVDIAFPPSVKEILDQAEDLLPDIQAASIDDIAACFPPEAWHEGIVEGTEMRFRFLALVSRSGPIVLHTDRFKR